MADTYWRSMASDDDPTIFCVMGFGLGLYWFFKGFREFRKYRVLADTPIVPIRGVAMGLVEIQGLVRGEHQIFSPVSHTPCFYYKVEIEKWKKDSKGRGRWSHHLTDQTGVSFYLQDTTGRVLIEPQGAELDLKRSSRREVGGGFRRGFTFSFGRETKTNPALGIGPSDSELLSYISSAGSGLFLPQQVPSTGPYGGPPSGKTSSVPLLPADARAKFDNFRQQIRRRRAGARTGALSALFDLARSGFGRSRGGYGGRFRLTEFCIVPDRPYDITGTCTVNPTPKDEDDRNMIIKGENEPTFVISWRSEKEIEGHLRWRAMKYIFGGALVAVVALAILLNHFGWL